jgi:protein subunit release factor A
MYEKLDEIEKRYDELQRKIADPGVATDVAVFRDSMKAIAEIEEVTAKSCNRRWPTRASPPT